VIKSVLILALILGMGLPSVQSAYAQCTEGEVIHWMNVRVVIQNPLIHDTEPDLLQFTNMLVQVPRDGGELYVFDFRVQLVVDRLNDIGYTQSDGDPVEVDDINSVSSFIDGYSTTCIDGIMQLVGGLLLKPDIATLTLAYAMVNAVWAVPTLAGLGIGIYLIKRRF